MKRIQTFSLLLGITLGLTLAGAMPYVQKTFAEDKKEAISQEELDRKLDDVLKDQGELKKRLEAVVTQTQSIKAASGK